MRRPAVVFAALVVAGAGQHPVRVAGVVPPGIGPLARVAWIPLDSVGDDLRCDLVSAASWACAPVLPSSRGIVVAVGALGVSATALGVRAIDPEPARWGRVIRVTPGAVAPDDLRGLTIAARKPERSRARPQATRFIEIDDHSVRVARLSDTVFWIAGGEIDPDAFIVLDAPAVAPRRMPTHTLPAGAPDDPLFWPADVAVTIAGRVHGPRGETDRVDLEVWQPLTPDVVPPHLDDETPAVRRRTLRTAEDGSFLVDRVDGGPILLSASHATLGQARQWITELGPPVDLALTPPVRAVGRVLRRGIPIVAAAVRFVPDIDAFAASADPRDYIGADARTGDDGRFALPLPRRHAGMVHIVADDGASVRVAMQDDRAAREVTLGDIQVPDGRRIVVRVIEGDACTLVAAGPLGALGLKIVRAVSATGVYELELPESGGWHLAADCGARVFGIDPPVVVVPSDREAPIVDARVLKSPG